MKYTAAIPKIKTFLQWKDEVIQLSLIDVEPQVLWFRGDADSALSKSSPCLSVSILVGQKWHQWDELECEWVSGENSEMIGLRPSWNEAQQKEFKKCLELTLSI